MFRIERADEEGNWALMMASPHRVGIGDLHGPSVSATVGGGDLYASLPTPGNKTHFAGKPGWQARVRYHEIVIERYEWTKIPSNEFDPESDMVWGWKLVEDRTPVIPFEALWPLSFVG